MNKTVRYFILILTIVIMMESVMVINSLEKKAAIKKISTIPTPTVVETPIIKLILESNNKEMVVGKTYKMEMSLEASEVRNLDVIENYIKYDPGAFKVANLAFNKNLPKPEAKTVKIDSEKGIISGTILFEDESGYKLDQNKKVSVLSFEVTPKKTGIFSFTAGDNKNADTILVENKTSEMLKYVGGKFDVRVVSK